MFVNSTSDEVNMGIHVLGEAHVATKNVDTRAVCCCLDLNIKLLEGILHVGRDLSVVGPPQEGLVKV
jgi:hypothetical protein